MILEQELGLDEIYNLEGGIWPGLKKLTRILQAINNYRYNQNAHQLIYYLIPDIEITTTHYLSFQFNIIPVLNRS